MKVPAVNNKFGRLWPILRYYHSRRNP